jgi:hypothetical protein
VAQEVHLTIRKGYVIILFFLHALSNIICLVGGEKKASYGKLASQFVHKLSLAFTQSYKCGGPPVLTYPHFIYHKTRDIRNGLN